jgi:hypothetical protein
VTTKDLPGGAYLVDDFSTPPAFASQDTIDTNDQQSRNLRTRREKQTIIPELITANIGLIRSAPLQNWTRAYDTIHGLRQEAKWEDDRKKPIEPLSDDQRSFTWVVLRDALFAGCPAERFYGLRSDR